MNTISKIGFSGYWNKTVNLYLGDLSRPIKISPEWLKEKTTIGIRNLEFLVGSTINFEYYKKNEMMANGYLCPKSNQILKDYNIQFDKSLDENSLLDYPRKLKFERITEIFFHGNRLTKNENLVDFVEIETDYGNNFTIPFSSISFKFPFNKNNYRALIFSLAHVGFYKIGERIEGYGICSTENKLVKNFELRLEYQPKELIDKYNGNSKIQFEYDKEDLIKIEEIHAAAEERSRQREEEAEWERREHEKKENIRQANKDFYNMFRGSFHEDML